MEVGVGGRREGKGKEGRRESKGQVVTYNMFQVITYCGQLLHIIIRGTQRCKTNFLKQKVLLEVSCYQSSKCTPFLFTCENWANTGSQNKGACPSSSWQTSGSGVYMGLELWRMYWVEWKTRNASPARKSREERRPVGEREEEEREGEERKERRGEERRRIGKEKGEERQRREGKEGKETDNTNQYNKQSLLLHWNTYNQTILLTTEH